MSSRRKQVDLGFTCPETALNIALEVCVSTFETEPSQAERDLAAGWDRVLVVCATKPQMTRLSRTFASQLGNHVDERITLCLPGHLREAVSIRHIYECPSLIYDSKHDKAAKKKKS